MNTTIGTMGLPVHAQRQVESWFHYVEEKLSRFLPDSELSQLNRSNGNPFTVSPLLYEVLATASYFYKETDGWFNPYLGSVLCELGYDRTFAELPTEKEPISVNYSALPRINKGILEPITMVSPATCIILLPGVSIDLGGIAKGWSGQMMRNWLEDDGIMSGLIDAGGDVVVWGEEGKIACDIAIADPFYPEQEIVTLKLNKRASIATSSILKRRWIDPYHQTFHHIIDPATQRSSQSDLVQATIIADDLAMAEVYTKCLLILGSEKGMAWLKERHPNLGFIGVRSDRSVLIGPSLCHHCLGWSVQT